MRPVSWLLHAARQRGALSHQSFERTPLCVGSCPGGVESSLRLEELGLRFSPLELPLGQHDRGTRDSLRPHDGVTVCTGARRGLKRLACLTDRALGVLCILAGFQPAQRVLELRGLGRIGRALNRAEQAQ